MLEVRLKFQVRRFRVDIITVTMAMLAGSGVPGRRTCVPGRH